MTSLSNRTRTIVFLLGLVQGLLLLAAHVIAARDIFKAPVSWILLVPWWAAAIGVPTALQLLLTDERDRRIPLFALALLGMLVLTGGYAGYMVEPSVLHNGIGPVWPYMLTTFVGWYVLLPFVQAYLKTGRLRPDYPVLFEFAWNNGITLLIACIFTGIFWALLGLWAGLFRVIGISFFSVLFYNKYFAYPVTAAVFAFAVYIGRSHGGAVVTVRRVILAVFKGLLPLLAVIALLFLAALPFMGLKPLWATRNATGLMLTLQILLLFFLNAVFQNGQGEPPYVAWLRALVRAAIVALPVYTVLCAYALALRIDQHGWSTERFWAALLTFVLGLHAFGYALAALRRSQAWMAAMAPVNVAIAGVVVALSVVVNSPLLDARRISAESQVGRLLNGTVAAAAFDYKYLRFDLGRAGTAALARLQGIGGRPDADVIRTSATLALKQPSRYGFGADQIETPAQAAARFAVYPRGTRLSDSFLKFVTAKNADWQLKRCFDVGQRCLVLAIDLNRDNRTEYILFRFGQERYDRSTAVYTEGGKGWHCAGSFDRQFSTKPQTVQEFERLLTQAHYAVADNPWRNLKLGEQTLQFQAQ